MYNIYDGVRTEIRGEFCQYTKLCLLQNSGTRGRKFLMSFTYFTTRSLFQNNTLNFNLSESNTHIFNYQYLHIEVPTCKIIKDISTASSSSQLVTQSRDIPSSNYIVRLLLSPSNTEKPYACNPRRWLEITLPSLSVEERALNTRHLAI